MWLLKDDKNERLIYLKPNATTTVGRNRGDIVLGDDNSISRLHAQIVVKAIPNSDQITDKSQPISTCTVKEAGSKYGNFILKGNEVTRITEEGYQLQHMDRVRFGLQNSIFTAHYIPIITVTSGMTEDEKKKLKKIIDAIDGKVSPVWNPLCTHMTVVKPTISEKLTCSLAAQTPIVPLDYWDSVLAAIKENTQLPDPAECVDSINLGMREIGEVSVSLNPARQTLFRNLTFLHFSTKQFTLYGRMIKLAGGKSMQFSPRRPIPDVCDGSVIVVQAIESNTTQATNTGDASYADVCEKLSRCRRRTIPESEIALAILHCSTEKYCNPLYDYAELFRRRAAENQTRDMTVLALDTQDVLPQPSTSRRGDPSTSAACIPETVTETCDTNVDTQNEYSKSSTNDLPTSPEYQSGDWSSVPSESQIGSMKMASLNHEHYVEEEFRRRLNENSSNKRQRDEEEDGNCEREKKVCLGGSSSSKDSKKKSSGPIDQDQSDVEFISDSEDEASVERNKKVGPRVSSIDAKKGQKQNGSSKSDLSYEEMMPDDEDVVFMGDKVAANWQVPEKKQEKWQNLASRLSPPKKVIDVSNPKRPGKCTEIDKLRHEEAPKLATVSSASRIGRDGFHDTGKKNLPNDSGTADENEQTRKGKIGRSDIWSDNVENPYKCDKQRNGSSKSDLSYEEMMPDDEDVVFMDDKVADNWQVPEKKQEKWQNLASRLSPPKKVNDVSSPRRPGKSTEIDKLRHEEAPKLTTVSSASRIGRDGFHDTGKYLTDGSGAADENEKTRKGKIVGSDIWSDNVENPYKCDKPEDTSQEQSTKQLPQNASVKRPLMDVTSPSLKCRKKYERKGDWIMSTSLMKSLEIKKDPGALDDNSRSSSSHCYEPTDCVKLSKDQNAPMISLLRVKCPAEIYTKDGPRFGKRFRKQKITIPPRVQLDVSGYGPNYVKKELKRELSLDDDDEDAITSRKVTANDRSKEKNFFRL